jgi:hypothetical protein
VISNYRAKQSVTFTHVKKSRVLNQTENFQSNTRFTSGRIEKERERKRMCGREQIAGIFGENHQINSTVRLFIATFYVGGKNQANNKRSVFCSFHAALRGCHPCDTYL